MRISMPVACHDAGPGGHGRPRAATLRCGDQVPTPHHGEPGMVENVALLQTALPHPGMKHGPSRPPPDVVAHKTKGEGPPWTVRSRSVRGMKGARMED